MFFLFVILSIDSGRVHYLSFFGLCFFSSSLFALSVSRKWHMLLVYVAKWRGESTLNEIGGIAIKKQFTDQARANAIYLCISFYTNFFLRSHCQVCTW